MSQLHTSPKSHQATPMLALDSLAATLGGSVIATVVTAVAAGTALVAGAFALYDLLVELASPAGAAAITAVVLAAVAILSAVLGQRMVRAKAVAMDRRLSVSRPLMGPEVYRALGHVGLAMLGLAAERAVRHKARGRHPGRHA